MVLEILSYASRQQPPQGILVMLHGWGANAQDVAALASYLDLSQVQFFFPNAPFAFPYGPAGRMWYDLPADYSFSSQADFRQQPQIQASREQLLTWLTSLESETGIPLSQTILAGFSQGGAMTLDVGLQLPLAAVMVLSGYAHAPIQIGTNVAPNVLMVHGRSDLVVPVQAAEQARDQLIQLGVPVQYHTISMGHEIDPVVLKLMQSFIEESVFSPDLP